MAKRRANGEGSLRKRKDGRWEGRYTAGTDPVTGKAIIKNVLGSYLAAADRRGLLPMFFLELTTGLRKGELVPLLWSDVDTNNMTISISKQAYRTKGALMVQPPKTDNSMRKIALSAETMELLKQEHDKHPGNPYLFPSPVTGGMYHPDSVVKLHQKILKDVGLEHIRFHDLRHTFATLALQNGIDVSCDVVYGHVQSGGDVSCDDIQGNVSAQGDVSCDDVEGSVSAGGDVSCDCIEGSVYAGGDVRADEVEGDITAGGGVYCDHWER